MAQVRADGSRSNMEEAYGMRRVRPAVMLRQVGPMAAGLFGLLWLAACGGGGDEEATPTAPPTTPTASQDRSTSTATPAEPAVTTTPAATATATTPPEPPSPDNVTFEDAFPGLPGIDRPTSMVELPGEERFLVASQEGQILSLAASADASEVEVALDWRERTSNNGSEEGLLGLAVSPDFERDGAVYAYYSAQPGERRSVISRFETSGTGADLRIDGESELVILEVPQPYGNHNGGQITFGPDEMLYVALGDGGSGGDPAGNGQNTATLLGSVLRIDVRGATTEAPYAIPGDNPFVDDPEARGEIWAHGFRNPWRMSFDRENGALWVADVGESTWEEVNRVEAGGNYGWNAMEGPDCFRGAACDPDAFDLPVTAYGHGSGHCSITGGHVGRSEAIGVLTGYYVYGDYCSGSVWALSADAASGSEAESIQIRGGGPQVASFAEDLDGRLYLLSFDGRIYQISG